MINTATKPFWSVQVQLQWGNRALNSNHSEVGLGSRELCQIFGQFSRQGKDSRFFEYLLKDLVNVQRGPFCSVIMEVWDLVYNSFACSCIA